MELRNRLVRERTPDTPAKFDVRHYRVERIDCEAGMARYLELMRQTYEPLGFWGDDVLPSPTSRCYEVIFQERTIAIFRLSCVVDPDSPFLHLVPEVAKGSDRLLEVNNVIVIPEFRASIALGLILLHSARDAGAHGYDFVVGTTRMQTLRHFVEFGVVPVYHPPLHVLGRRDLQDFVIYYDTRTPESRTYMEERARRYFHQQYVLKRIVDAFGTRASSEADLSVAHQRAVGETALCRSFSR